MQTAEESWNPDFEALKLGFKPKKNSGFQTQNFKHKNSHFLVYFNRSYVSNCVVIITDRSGNKLRANNGLLFLCWFLGVVPFNPWLISSWEENKCCSKLTRLQLFSLKMTTFTILSDIDVTFTLCNCSACNNNYFFLSLR